MTEYDLSIFDKYPIGLLFVFSIVIGGAFLFLWITGVFDEDYKSRSELITEEKDKVRKLSCGGLKDYILLGYDGEWRRFYQGDFAKELFEWKCEK